MESSRSVSLVVHAEVLRYYSPEGSSEKAMDLRVRRVLRGKAESIAVRVWGDNGRQCRPYVTRFPIGSEWVFALDKFPDGPGNPVLLNRVFPGDYFISICGTYWLPVKDTYVVGAIVNRNAQDRVPVAELERIVEPKDALKRGVRVSP